MDGVEILEMMISEGRVIEDNQRYRLSEAGKAMFWAAYAQFREVRECYHKALAEGMHSGLAELMVVGELYRLALSKEQE
mgnify:CR=1 FL=1